MVRKLWVPVLAIAALFVFASPAWSASDDANAGTEMTAEQFVASLHPITGNVHIAPANATLKMGTSYSYLEAKDAQRVLTDLWNNPPDKDVLGMILPGTDPHVVLKQDAWAVIVYFVNDGYVSDEDAHKIDYDEMLRDMQKGTRDSNAERVKEGYPALELRGWAEPPHYDAKAHKLYWASDLAVKKEDGSLSAGTLNYGIRVLGRKGYLSLNAVAPMDQLANVRADMPQVLAMTEFDDGERYTDYKAGTDKLAAYGLGALIAGVAAKKLGLLAIIAAFAAKFFKVGIVALIAFGAGLKRLFSRKPKADASPAATHESTSLPEEYKQLAQSETTTSSSTELPERK
ncbi:DUF2167 domain-containing protein [Paraburkholderia dinghuensis]|uniref:DUF2167 domain-containing protein n=2 Tax=Paraburkholderia dinghuensis TaxID=2305225 RepID=A0A3N6MQ97_9BURK|nr:DUF2167 domain-containing protein [Paraburkholderia dinghuensis]